MTSAPTLLRDTARLADAEDREDLPPAAAIAEPPARRRFPRVPPIVWFVLLPTLLVTAFEYLVAADQYQSEAHFIVRSSQSSPSASPLAQMLSGASGGGSNQSDAHSVGDYLLSHDAVAALGKRLDLVAIFRRNEADPVTRLLYADPAPETLLRYYRRMVDVDYSSETGITELSVRAFRPDDAERIARELLRLSEERVNSLNARLLRDGASVAAKEVAGAEADVTAAQHALTGLRETRREIDPERSGMAQITLASQLEQAASVARAQLATMTATLSPGAPQLVAQARQVRAMEAQAARARAGVVDRRVSTLGSYEELSLRRDMAAKRYETAAAGLAAARAQLARQQLFIMRVVEPNRPVESTYPKRLKIIGTVLLGLLVAYAIGWLILAGVREHAA